MKSLTLKIRRYLYRHSTGRILFITSLASRTALTSYAIFLDKRKDEPGIIYCLSRKSTEMLAANLKAEGFSAEAYHAGLDNVTKARNQEAFLRDDINIIVATIAFGMGINKSNVRYVVHMDLLRTSRVTTRRPVVPGRDGLPSDAILYYSPGDAQKLKEFARVENNPEQSRIMLKKLADMVRYSRLQTCRRQFLLEYFDEARAGKLRSMRCMPDRS